MERLKKEAYEVFTLLNSGGKASMAYFSSKEVADKFAEGKGEWGSKASVSNKPIDIVIYDTIEEYEKDRIAKNVEAMQLTVEMIKYIKENK